MDKDYISVLEAAKIVKMSPSRFANLLREEREQLPVELNYELVNQLGNYHAQRGFSLKINDNWLEKIYDKGFDMVGHFPILMIHRLDWKNFLSNRKKDVMMPLHHKLEEAQARITELETELTACREQLEEALREISDKKYEYFFEAYPVCKMICDLHLAGNSQAEIRAALIDKGYTNAQTGFLTQEDTLIRSDDAVKQSVKRSQKKLKV